jgi:hypothetical protein
MPVARAPVASVKSFSMDMTVSCVGWRADGVEYFLAGPGRGADHATEILWPDGGVLVGKHIGFDIAADIRWREVGAAFGDCGHSRRLL